MHTGGYIQYVDQQKIDRAKWDACIDQAPNGLVYAYSFYLDAMATHWDALVLNDYELIMPLTWNRKYGFYYLFQPAFTASLGIFGKNITKELILSFIAAIPNKFKLVEISLNSGNNVSPLPGNMKLRSNYVLYLNKNYTGLFEAYRDNHKRNISKALQAGCAVKKNIAVNKIIQLNQEFLRGASHAPGKDYSNFKKIYELLKRNNKAETYGVVNKNNQLLASCVFFFSHKRAFYILVGNHPGGKTIGASHALIDAFIKDHAGEDIALDFEGSDFSSLAFFYSGFGAKEEPYPFLKINRLPFYLKWMKG